MGIEQQRAKLMATSRQWGDHPRPESPSYHVQPTQSRLARESSIEPSSGYRSASGDMHMAGDMNIATKSLLTPLPVISTLNWTLDDIIKTGRRFYPVHRIPVTADTLLAKIDEYEQSGSPLIIEGVDKHPRWPADKFHIDSFSARSPPDITVRNVCNWSDKTIKLADFIAKSRATSPFAVPGEQERLYGKDAECPEEWYEWLDNADVIPPLLLPDGPANLLLNQPRSARVETLMCYLGIGDTFTPCHKDLCASSGQNLMCYTENGGSSFWFMTDSSSAGQASKYFHQLEQELDHETHIITVQQLAQAPFNVYIAEQKLGDLVLVPPRSCHQVVNYGGITVKTSWSRMTLKGLAAAYYHELPIYRRVCRPEVYRVKSTIHHTLVKNTMELQTVLHSIDAATDSRSTSTPRDSTSTISNGLPISMSGLDTSGLLVANRHATNLIELLLLYDDILIEEYSQGHDKLQCLTSSPPSSHPPSPSPSNAASPTLTPDEKAENAHITCDFCGADVFQSFFECRVCVHPSGMDPAGGNKAALGDGYVVCAGCYAEGRSCLCEIMDAVQCRPFASLLWDRKRASKILCDYMQISGLSLPLEPEPDLSSKVGAFRAACALHKARKSKRETKTCTSMRGNIPSHIVPFASALSCKGCHNAKCFLHILRDQKIHSIDALVHHSIDDSHERYHQYHLASRAKFEEGLPAFLLSQKQGSRPDAVQLRGHMASTYGTCKPINPLFMKPGWYDSYVQILSTALNPENALHEPPERKAIDTQIPAPSLPSRSLPPLSPLIMPLLSPLTPLTLSPLTPLPPSPPNLPPPSPLALPQLSLPTPRPTSSDYTSSAPPMSKVANKTLTSGRDAHSTAIVPQTKATALSERKRVLFVEVPPAPYVTKRTPPISNPRTAGVVRNGNIPPYPAKTTYPNPKRKIINLPEHSFSSSSQPTVRMNLTRAVNRRPYSEGVSHEAPSPTPAYSTAVEKRKMYITSSTRSHGDTLLFTDSGDERPVKRVCSGENDPSAFRSSVQRPGFETSLAETLNFSGRQNFRRFHNTRGIVPVDSRSLSSSPSTSPSSIPIPSPLSATEHPLPSEGPGVTPKPTQSSNLNTFFSPKVDSPPPQQNTPKSLPVQTPSPFSSDDLAKGLAGLISSIVHQCIENQSPRQTRDAPRESHEMKTLNRRRSRFDATFTTEQSTGDVDSRNSDLRHGSSYPSVPYNRPMRPRSYERPSYSQPARYPYIQNTNYLRRADHYSGDSNCQTQSYQRKAGSSSDQFARNVPRDGGYTHRITHASAVYRRPMQHQVDARSPSTYHSPKYGRRSYYDRSPSRVPAGTDKDYFRGRKLERLTYDRPDNNLEEHEEPRLGEYRITSGSWPPTSGHTEQLRLTTPDSRRGRYGEGPDSSSNLRRRTREERSFPPTPEAPVANVEATGTNERSGSSRDVHRISRSTSTHLGDDIDERGTGNEGHWSQQRRGIELSADWEDGYEQHDGFGQANGYEPEDGCEQHAGIAPEKQVFATPYSHSQPSGVISSTFHDSIPNPWIQ